MKCNAPTIAIRHRGINPETGKAYKPFVYHKYTNDDDFLTLYYQRIPSDWELLVLPCGKCLCCTRVYRRQWSLRILHELRYHDAACYLTLTCDDAHIDDVFPRLPGAIMWHSLSKRPLQLFFKRLRKHLGRDRVIRYYACGEYGDTTHRPHYHAIVFGWYPDDSRILVSNPSYRVSETLAMLWPYGYHTIGNVTEYSASYVAGYVDKKLDGNRTAFAGRDPVAPEYVVMSRGSATRGTGGIGRQYLDQYESDLYPLGSDGVLARSYALLNGKPVKMPKYYDNILGLRDPQKFVKIKAQRQVGAADVDEDAGDWLDECHHTHEFLSALRCRRVKAC